MKIGNVIAVMLGLVFTGGAAANVINPFWSGPNGVFQDPNVPLWGGLDFLYQIDDGTAESQLGLTAGGDIAFIQAFTVEGGNDIITDIQMSWGSPVTPGGSGLLGGEPFTVHLWSDDDGDGDPRNGGFTLLTSQAGNVDPLAIESNVLQTVAITPMSVGTHFFIGLDIDQVAGQYPASRDENTQSLLRAYVSGDGAMGGWDPVTMSGSIGLFDLAEIGFDSVYLMRANGIPTPGALALLGLAGLLGRRRR